MAGVATGWTVTAAGAATLTKTKVAATDLYRGEWQQIECAAPTPGVDGFLFSWVQTTGLVAGARWRAAMEFETDAASFDCRRILFQGYCIGTTSHAGGVLSSTAVTPTSLYRMPSGVFVTPVFTLPAGVTQVQVQTVVRGPGTWRFRRAQLVPA